MANKIVIAHRDVFESGGREARALAEEQRSRHGRVRSNMRRT